MTLQAIKQLRKLGRRARALIKRPLQEEPVREPPRPQPALDVDALRAEYAARGLADEPDRFILCRIIGNDLPPRHAKGSARANVRFILEREPDLADCRKTWLVNRIVDPREEEAVIALLERHRQSYRRIPFRIEKYAQVGWDLDRSGHRGGLLRLAMQGIDVDRAQRQLPIRTAKNNYVMNNNGARNAALQDGRAAAKWVMPWDGNCFLGEAAWSELREAVLAQPYVKYFIVPMARIASNRAVLNPSYRPQAADEPQILFRRDAELMFDPAYPYGMAPKVELLLRLGVPGPWDNLDLGPKYHATKEAAAHPPCFLFAGWVTRLQSGRPRQEIGQDAMRMRRRKRGSAIITMLDALDERVMSARLQPGRLMLYRPDSLDRLRDAARAGGPAPEAWQDAAWRLVADARTAMERGLCAVTDQTGCAPSGDRHDYWSAWPDPGTPIPEAPDTAGAEQVNRSRLQRVLEDAAICALAWRISGKDAFAAHGAALLRRWFLARRTRMNPHLRYAHMRSGQDGENGSGTGLVEMRDLPLLLDGARLLAEAGALGWRDRAKFRAWLTAYRDWMCDSRQGGEALLAPGHIGTVHDLQAAAIGAYLGDSGALVEIFRRCRERIQIQFDPDGSQPHEVTRPDGLHACCFNLQAWSALARIAETCGEDLWSYRARGGHSLRRGLDWLLAFDDTRAWPHGGQETFDWHRLVPLKAERDRLEGHPAAVAPPALQRFPAETGIRPYWFL